MDSFLGPIRPLLPQILLASIGLPAAFCCTYYLCWAVYNVFFHPLRKIPGPFLSAASDAPHFIAIFTGNGVTYVKGLHDRYGPVVRIGPNRVACNGPTAIKDVYGHQPGRPDLIKDPELYIMPPSGVRGIGESDDVNHGRQRRYLGPAFSNKALEEGEYLTHEVVDRLVGRLKERIGQEVDLVPWFDWTLFDAIGILALGYDFACLKNAAYHPWISDMFSNFKVMGLMFAAQSIPGLSILLKLLVPKSLFERRLQNFQFLRSLVLDRMTATTTRKDFMSYIIAHADDKDVKEGEMETNAWSIVIAGSETTATLLDGAMYHLLSHPAVLSKLTAEIRATCKSEVDIRAATVADMPYLIAVLDEALRMYPPAPFGLSRVVPVGGATMGSFFLPAGSRASASHWCVFHNDANFTDPDSFVPERWLDGRQPKYEGDKRDALMPFSAGRRNCIAKNLAIIQMRLILVRLLWNFDFELCESSRDWDHQKVYMAWKKKPLNVRVLSRKN